MKDGLVKPIFSKGTDLSLAMSSLMALVLQLPPGLSPPQNPISLPLTQSFPPTLCVRPGKWPSDRYVSQSGNSTGNLDSHRRRWARADVREVAREGESYNTETKDEADY